MAVVVVKEEQATRVGQVVQAWAVVEEEAVVASVAHHSTRLLVLVEVAAALEEALTRLKLLEVGAEEEEEEWEELRVQGVGEVEGVDATGWTLLLLLLASRSDRKDRSRDGSEASLTLTSASRQGRPDPSTLRNTKRPINARIFSPCTEMCPHNAFRRYLARGLAATWQS